MTLDDWIRKELTVDVESILSKYKERVRELLNLAPSGEVLIKSSNFKTKEKILAYLIGKTYAKVAGYSQGTATNKELSDALHLNENTVRYNLFKLREEGLVLSVANGVHQIKIANLEKTFNTYFGGENKV